MSTHAGVGFYQEDGQQALICSVHHHSDGYPTGVGMDLAEWLLKMRVGNGIKLDQPAGFANGMGCLAAQYVAAFKKKPGQVYLVAPGSDWEEDYFYEVRWVLNPAGGGAFDIRVYDYDGQPEFCGSIDEYITYYNGRW